MPVTFGSIGDIIAVSLLIKDLIKCLDGARGSSAEYQSILLELQDLDYALSQVGFLLSHQELQKSGTLEDTALRTAEHCKTCIRGFREHIKRYNGSLRDGGSGNLVKDAAFKIKWGLSGKEGISQFRNEIKSYCLALSMLLMSANT